MYREGKVHAFHVGPAENRDLADVIKYYFNQGNDTLGFIKLLGTQSEEIQRESLNHIDELSPRGRAVLLDLFRNHVADKVLYIDCESPDFMKMAKVFNPNIRRGAYTNDQIAHISRRALRKYTENPKVDYLKYFMDEMIHSKRAISPDMLKHYNQNQNISYNQRPFTSYQNRFSIGNNYNNYRINNFQRNDNSYSPYRSSNQYNVIKKSAIVRFSIKMGLEKFVPLFKDETSL